MAGISKAQFRSDVTRDEDRHAVRLAKQREAQRRYRERHPERVRAAQLASDQRPERLERQRKRVALKRTTEAYKTYRKEYLSRPEVRARQLERNKQEKAKARLARWRQKPESKKKRAIKMREFRATVIGALQNRMAVSLRRGLRAGKEGKTWQSLAGYSVADLRTHLERQFKGRMSWENMDKWHVDHIVPLSAFNFSSPTDPDFKAAWALTNLRPLWAAKNMAKGAKREVLL